MNNYPFPTTPAERLAMRRRFEAERVALLVECKERRLERLRDRLKGERVLTLGEYNE